MNIKLRFFEWVILIIIILFEVIIFVFRLLTPANQLNQITIVLLDTFQIVFSLYIGFFLQRIDSAKQVQENLRNYGLLAYRRVTDIKKSINRSIDEIQKMKNRNRADNIGELDSIKLVLEGTIDTVESSVLDWVDIIGEELKKKEKVDRLEQEYALSKLNLNVEGRNNINELKQEIEKLYANIPMILQANNKPDTRFEDFMTTIYSTKRMDESFLLFARITLALPLSEVDRRKISDGSPYTLKMSYRYWNVFVDIYNKDKDVIGYLIPSVYQHELIIKNGLMNRSDITEFSKAFDNIFSVEDYNTSNDNSAIFEKCDFGGFDEEGYFKIEFKSREFPHG